MSAFDVIRNKLSPKFTDNIVFFHEILTEMDSEADESPAALDDDAHSMPDTTFGSSFRQHFLFVIDHVSNEPCFASLFLGEDADCIGKFTGLSGRISINVKGLRKRAGALPKPVSKITEIVPIKNLSSPT